MSVAARVRLVVPIVALCGVAACGTTVQLPAGVTATTGGSASSGLSLPPGAGGSGSTATTVPSAAGTTPLAGGEGAAISTSSRPVIHTTAPVGVPGSSKTTGPVGKLGHTPVSIGFFVSKDVGGEFKALGYGGLSTGDGAQEVRASVKLVNAKGGIAGHPIKPIIIEEDPESTTENTYQQACATFFQDNHVTAVVSLVYSPVFSSCAAQHQALLLFASLGSTLSASALRAAPTTVVTDMPTIDTDAADVTDALIKEGFFKGGTSLTSKPVIGLITLDSPSYASAQSIVSQHLAAAGLKLTDTFKMPAGNESSDIARASAAGQSAVLRFKAEGINHVVFVSGGFGASWFGVDARTESYYPRLGWGSAETPGLEPQVLSPRQLSGSEGIGWSPTLDTSPQFEPTLGSHGAACIKALRAGGVDMSVGATLAVALPICDATFLLAAPPATSTLTGLGLLAGIQQLATSYSSAMNFTTDFRNRAATAGARPIAYKAGCDCFRYVGPIQPLR